MPFSKHSSEQKEAAKKLRNERSRTWYENNKELSKERNRNRYHRLDPEAKKVLNRTQRLRKYGLTQEDFDELLKSQGGVCAICKGPPVVHQTFHIDHDHKSGSVRGLLCQPCNTSIGHMSENPERLRAAAAYLEKFNA